MFFLISIISKLLIIQSAFCENATNPSPTTTTTATISETTTEAPQTTSQESQSLPQPASQSQQIERTLEPTNRTNLNRTKMLSDFKPSPLVETYYEFNKFPVKPAFAEAKHFHQGYSNHVQIEQSTFAPRSAPEQPWTTRIQFPQPDNNYNNNNNKEPSKFDHQYHQYNHKSSSSSPGKTEEFSFNKLVEVPGRQNVKHSSGNSWENFGLGYKSRLEGNLGAKTLNYNLMETPAQSTGYLPKTSGFGSLDTHHQQENPWKKIIKILTAFIPIGLLISALTPTVITVTPVNDTQTRYRSDDKRQDVAKRLISSINHYTKLNDVGCENRIFCELLLSASNSKNGEQHVQNLLNNISEQDENLENKAEEMKRIFGAVKKQDCSTILCKNSG